MVASWAGLVVPKGTPPAIIAKLNTAVVKVLGTPETKEQFLAQGGEAVSSTPQEFARFIRADYERIAKVARVAGLRAD